MRGLGSLRNLDLGNGNDHFHHVCSHLLLRYRQFSVVPMLGNVSEMLLRLEFTARDCSSSIGLEVQAKCQRYGYTAWRGYVIPYSVHSSCQDWQLDVHQRVAYRIQHDPSRASEYTDESTMDEAPAPAILPRRWRTLNNGCCRHTNTLLHQGLMLQGLPYLLHISKVLSIEVCTSTYTSS